MSGLLRDMTDYSKVRLLLLSPLAPGSGNFTTITRIRSSLENDGLTLFIEGADSFSSAEEFIRYVEDKRINVTLGLHAFRSGKWLRYLENVPYILIFGGTDLISTDLQTIDVMTNAVDSARAIVGFSKENIQTVSSTWANLDMNRVHIVPQAVVTSPFEEDVLSSIKSKHTLAPHTKVFTIITGIRKVKDPVFLIDAFSDWDIQEDVCLMFLGPIIEREYAKNFISKVERSSRVIYIGNVSVEQTHAIIRDSYALVNCSISEGMCVSILEAQYLETPVLARNIPGNRSMVHHKSTGLLFSTPKEFCDLAEELLNNKQLEKNLIKNAKKQVSLKHNVVAEKNSYLEIIDKIVGKL